MKKLFPLAIIMSITSAGCAVTEYNKTVPSVDLGRFFKKWYVIAGRFTFLENGAHNAIEEYKFNEKEKRIDIHFQFNKGSLSGPLKKINQKAWVENEVSQAHWKISPFWPLKFDYLVIALADDYSWTAIGVPNQQYLWIMADHWNVDESELRQMIDKIQSLGYPTNDIVRIPQKW